MAFISDNKIGLSEEDEHSNQRKLEDYIRTYTGNDPLQPFYEYIMWLSENHTKMDADNSLLHFLENTLIKFKDFTEYKQDRRFVQLIVKYIKYQTNLLEFYQLVYDQGLGAACSLLYISWAEELDKFNEFKRADQIYQLGIKHQAQPLKEIQDAHIQFQLNLARRMLEGKIGIIILPSENQKLSRKMKHNTKEPPRISRCNRTSNRRIIENRFKVINGKENTYYAKSKVNDEMRSTKNECQDETMIKIQTCTKKVNELVEKNKFEVLGKYHKVGLKKNEFKCPIAVFEPVDPNKKTMYPKQLVYVDGKDIQLEEITAARYFQKMREKHIEEPLILTKCLNASLEHRPAEVPLPSSNVSQKCFSPTENQMLKKTFSDSYFTKSITEDHSWFLKTDFIKPVILPLAYSSTVPTSTFRKSPSESRISNKPVMLKRKSNFIVGKSVGTTTSIANYGRQSQMFYPAEGLPKQPRIEDEEIQLNKGSLADYHLSPPSTMTVNTHAAISMVHNCWRSPSSIPRADLEAFKKPLLQKSQQYEVPVYYDVQIKNTSEQSQASVPPNLQFHVYVDESERENKDKLRFSITEPRNVESVEKNNHANANNGNTQLEVIKNVYKEDLITSRIFSNARNKSKTAGPLIIPLKLHGSFHAADKENLRPQNNSVSNDKFIGSCIKPMFISDSSDKKQELFDETCSTKVFSVRLPSSTPFKLTTPSKRKSKSSVFSGSYDSEDENMIEKCETSDARASSSLGM